MQVEWNGQEVIEMKVFQNAEMLWIRFVTKDGKQHDTYVFKGTT